MSIYASNAFQTAYDSLIKPVYQASRYVSPFVNIRTGVKGDSYKFNRSGNANAHQRNPKDNYVLSNVQYAQPRAYLKTYSVADYSTDIDQIQLPFDEKAALAEELGLAMGRQRDQLVFDAFAETEVTNSSVLDFNNPKMRVILGDGSSPASATSFVSAEAKPFGFGALTQIVQAFANAGVPMGDRYLAVDPQVITALLQLNELTNILYVADKPIVEGALTYALGLNIIPIGQYPIEGQGLPTVTFTGTPDITGRVAYAWSRKAMGLAIGLDFAENMRIDWVPQNGSWLVSDNLLAGGVAIDPSGLIKIVHHTV